MEGISEVPRHIVFAKHQKDTILNTDSIGEAHILLLLQTTFAEALARIYLDALFIRCI